jgi:hypothetical protein
MDYRRKFAISNWRKGAGMLLLSFFISIAAPRGADAQVTTATLSGSVTDSDQAIVPGAQVTITNRNNKFVRMVKSNGSGDFSFASIQFGDYDVVVTFPGFQKYQVTNIHLNPGDTRTLAPVRLKPGAADVVVNVNGASANEVADSGERSSVITSETINKLTLQSREVTELLKILPGSAISTGNAGNQSAVSNSAFDNSNTQLGGAASGYSMSGSPTNGVSIRSDGANLTDPSTYSGSLQNINPDTTAEVKVEQQNFGADTANGPLVINAVSKSGGADFHGSIYTNARDSELNANDAFAKELDQTRPPDRYIYPGATFGGPVIIPHTNFNHNKRLTFFVSGEDLVQKNAYAYGNVSSALQTALVPTAAMRQGDFSVAQLQQYLPPGAPICAANPNNGSAVCNGTGQTLGVVQSTTYANVSVVPISAPDGTPVNCNGNTGNDCLSPYLDPGAVAQFKLIPLPNTPNGQTTTGAYNYIARNLVDNDLWNAHGKLDLKLGEHNTFSLSYNAEFGNTFIPQATGYYASGDSGGILTPGGTKRAEHTHSGSFNWTDVFNSTTTNEFFLSGTYSDHFDTPGDPSKLFNSAIGYPYTGAYLNGTKQFPTFTDYGYDGLPVGIYPDYSYGPQFTKTLSPGLGDNLTKEIKRHTVKVGVNVERPSVNGTLPNVGSSPTNGAISNYYTAPTFFLPPTPNSTAAALTYHTTCYSASDPFCSYSGGTNNQLANYLTGSFSSYQQANIIPDINLLNWTTSFYVNDDYKVTSRLTIQVGLRFEHLGRWQDQHGQGAAVWRPDLYAGDPINSTTLPLPGFRWHGIDKSVPLGGWNSRLFFYEPRAGFTYDLYGDAKTTLSGGWGQYRFHEGQSDFENTLTTTNGLRTVTINNPNSNFAGLRMSYVQQLMLSPSASNTFLSTDTNYPTTTSSAIYGVQQGDTESPLTTTYSFTVTQQMPKSLVFSIGYAGNQSKYLLNDGSNQQIFADNINAIPVDSFFRPDPNPGSKFFGITYTAANIPGISSSQQNDYRPYPHYGDIQVLAHTLYSNYNALQATLNRSKGMLSFGINYTYSKALGVRGSYFNGIPGDSFNLRNDYGVQSYDRTHIFNAWYDFNEGIKFHGNHIVAGTLNGWEISGYTGIQSGPDLQATNYASNYGLQGSIPATATQNSYSVSNITFLGTPDVSLQPKLTCNPSSGLHHGQYLNAACFQLPVQGGDNGPFIYPYSHGPAYLDTDMTAIKNFKISDTKNLQFRLAGFNFINHPLATFSNKAPQATQLQFQNGETINRNLFGYTTYETGRRQVEVGAKYTF